MTDYTVSSNQDLLKARLKNEILLVTFAKLDGDIREMSCTLNPTIIPQREEKESTRTRPASSTSLSVWDTDANGWRSFRWELIKSVE